MSASPGIRYCSPVSLMLPFKLSCECFRCMPPSAGYEITACPRWRPACPGTASCRRARRQPLETYGIEERTDRSSRRAKNGQSPFAMAHDPVTVAAERDPTSPCPTCPWQGTVCREGVSRGRAVQTIRTHVSLQPGQKGANKRLGYGIAATKCESYATIRSSRSNGLPVS